MKRTLPLLLALGAAPAAAQRPHDVCVNPAIGVPTHGGPPAWASWTGGPTEVNPSVDDPRWNEATAHDIATGGASPAVHVRALSFPDSAGTQYLYLSIVGNVNPNDTTTRDVYVGFRRANPGISGDDTGVYGYVLQFHLGPANNDPSTTETAHAMPYCGAYAKPECVDAMGTTSLHDWWRVFRDFNAPTTKSCDGVSVTGEQFKEWNGTAGYLAAPFTWLDGAAHAWKLNTSTWAVQLRIKIAPTNTASPAPISAGIEAGSTIWYEVTETQGTLGSKPQSLGKFPTPDAQRTGVTNSICVASKANNDNQLLHPDLSDPSKYAALSIGARPDCDAGLKIDRDHIGAVYVAASSYDTVGLNREIKSVDSAGNPVTNIMVAQVTNTNPPAAGSGGTIAASVQARFRIANFGSTPTGDITTGSFDDVPGGSAVCLPEGSPPCAPVNILAGEQKAIHFNWALTKTEVCQYGLPPRSGDTCTETGCPSGQIKSTVENVCVTKHNPHECMYVELSSAGGPAIFDQASAFTNMDFAQMSTVAREVLLDSRKLPVAPGQREQDLYLYVVPRNMPATMPTQTLTDAIHAAALAKATALAKPYLADIDRLKTSDPEKLAKIIADLARQRPPLQHDDKRAPPDERTKGVELAMEVMPNVDFARARGLLRVFADPGEGQFPDDALVHETVQQLGPAEAASIVPTLEVYPFYLPMDKAPTYQPMTSFTVFLSHENTLAGIRYELDGAERIAPNVYHLKIPVGFARRLQVRAHAVQPPEGPLAPGNPRWPCSGGCACGGGAKNCGLVGAMGNLGPGMVAGVFAVGRRRRRRR